MTGIDRKKVKNAFDRHAMEYDLHASVQKRIVSRIAELLRELPGTPRRVLDIGSGTGMLLKELAVIYPAVELIGLDLASGMCKSARAHLATHPLARLLTGEAEALPFGDNVFDLVVSTSTFQWLESLDRTFAEVFRVLTPEGRFVFALFGGHTLFELRRSYRAAWEMTGQGPEVRTHTFHGITEVEAALGRAGYTDASVSAELEVEHHPDIPALLRSLRRIGAGNAAPAGSRGLAERRVMLDMMGIYSREYSVDGLIPATYEVIYGEAGKGG
jgi:malonyl-CoA O-methyltransferase